MSTFQPPPDGFDNALRRSRARRHRRHLVEAAAGGTTLAVVAAIVLTTHPGGLATLQQEQPAGPGTAHPTATAPSSTTPTLTPAPTAGASTLAPGSTSQPFAGPGASSTALPSTGASSSPARSAGTFISSPLSRRTTAYSNLTPCADTSGRQATGWCVQPGDSFTGRAGHPNTLAASLCRLPGVGDGQANFPTSLEATFAIHTPAPADRTVWNLDAQHPGHPSPHTITVTAGQCLTWTAIWEGRDNTGRDLPAGHYTLVLSINTDNIGNPNQVIAENYDYTVSG